MVPDCTINDAFHNGFECGLLYILRYAEEQEKLAMGIDDVSQLARHLAEKKPWKTNPEWESLILSNL